MAVIDLGDPVPARFADVTTALQILVEAKRSAALTAGNEGEASRGA